MAAVSDDTNLPRPSWNSFASVEARYPLRLSLEISDGLLGIVYTCRCALCKECVTVIALPSLLYLLDLTL